MPLDAPSSLVVLALSCTKYEPSERPSAADVQDWLHDLCASTEADSSTPLLLKTLPSFPDDSSAAATAEDRDLGGIKSLHATRESMEEAYVRKQGYLFKRNSTGFRQWKKVMFMLTRSHLYWKSSTGIAKGNLSLKGAYIKKTILYRFQILHSIDEKEYSKSARASLEPITTVGGLWGLGGQAHDDHRELAADSKAEMEEWIHEINDAIEAANEEDLNDGEYHPRTSSVGSSASLPMVQSFLNITDWLTAMRLQDYVAKFDAKSFDLSHIGSVGLTKEDLDLLGIVHPNHRRMLIASAGTPFSTSLCIDVTRFREFGSVVMFTILSHYNFSRSLSSKRFTDFRNLDLEMRIELKIFNALLLARMPILPSQLPFAQGLQNPANIPSILSNGSHDTEFLRARRKELDEYLRQLHLLVIGESIYNMIS